MASPNRCQQPLGITSTSVTQSFRNGLLDCGAVTMTLCGTPLLHLLSSLECCCVVYSAQIHLQPCSPVTRKGRVENSKAQPGRTCSCGPALQFMTLSQHPFTLARNPETVSAIIPCIAPCAEYCGDRGKPVGLGCHAPCWRAQIRKRVEACAGEP
jgi:hypothetical protein